MQNSVNNSNKLDMWIMTNGKFLPPEKIPFLRERLGRLPEDHFSSLYALQMQDPTVLLIVSIFIGYLGIDRFMLGEVGLGLLKLFTLGGCGIWTIVDWFLIMGKTREANYQKVEAMLNYYGI